VLNAIAERTLNAGREHPALRRPTALLIATDGTPQVSLRRRKRTGRRNWKISPAGTPAVADVSRSMSRSSAHKSR
jgi:hypothetical protein